MKGQTPIINGVLLAAVVVYLSWYFSVNGMWNAATVVITLILAMLCAGQFIIWYMFFRKGSRKEPESPKEREGTNSGGK